STILDSSWSKLRISHIKSCTLDSNFPM
ncbi:hypothetical protein CP8484711_2341B, partial [Chlamydia psittaci 84-8471/1]